MSLFLLAPPGPPPGSVAIRLRARARARARTRTRAHAHTHAHACSHVCSLFASMSRFFALLVPLDSCSLLTFFYFARMVPSLLITPPPAHFAAKRSKASGYVGLSFPLPRWCRAWLQRPRRCAGACLRCMPQLEVRAHTEQITVHYEEQKIASQSMLCNSCHGRPRLAGLQCPAVSLGISGAAPLCISLACACHLAAQCAP